MQKTEKENWDNAEKTVSELIKDVQRQATRWYVAWLVTLAALVGTNAYWIHQWNSYDYVSQDGNGYNYYNADIEGDVNNGPENQEKEEQEEIQGG